MVRPSVSLVLLAFMFLWNMVGALVLIPALSHFLLNDRHFAKRVPVPAVAMPA